MFLTTATFLLIKKNPLKLLFSFIISLTLSIPTIFFVHPIFMAFKNFLLGMFFLDLELFTARSNKLVRDDCHDNVVLPILARDLKVI